ncbi:DsbA family oxidoreductase [Polynucleobacter sp. UB-Piko-W3]|uniref:DsbA family oxidoreductase n=1 Tax=Polynucleobacter sp. UB-Piko-W3 TaxID=1819735 RepID=UPI001C0DEC5A|nr:DsbA family oxidoreductase [Polynucleobacter sp. UB-Piko-W3]MBU3554049.1 DsbA family oxidoreductase [Polynucleobacter sp. UB-Piko-W3]
MKPTIKIHFVSDIGCPWCAVALGALEQAIERLSDQADFEIHFEPFELNPQMKVGGENAIEYLANKYGISEQQVKANQANIRERAAAAGFNFHPEGRKKIYNTFDAHRLLYWAGHEHGLASQHRLKREFFNTYFCLAADFDKRENLLEAVQRAHLDQSAASKVLEEGLFTKEVRAQAAHYRDQGINAVPNLILNNKYSLQGAQPLEILEASLKEVIQKSSQVT